MTLKDGFRTDVLNDSDGPSREDSTEAGILRWIQLLQKRLLTGGPFGSGQPLKRKRQRTIHPRGRVIEKPIQALADVIALADVDPPLRTVDSEQTRGVRRLVDASAT